MSAFAIIEQTTAAAEERLTAIHRSADREQMGALWVFNYFPYYGRLES